MSDASCSPVLSFCDKTYDSLVRTAKGCGKRGPHRALLYKRSASSWPMFCVETGVRRDVPLPGVAVSLLDVRLGFDYAHQGPVLHVNASPRWSGDVSDTWSNILPCVGGGYPDCVTCAADGCEFGDHVAFLCAPSQFLGPMFYVECATYEETLVFDAPVPVLGDLLALCCKEQLDINSDGEAKMLAAADMCLTNEARNMCLECVVQSMNTVHCLDLAALAPLCLHPQFRGDEFYCAHEHINQFEADP